MPKLEITTPGADPLTHELKADVIVGRAAPATLVVADSKVSRRHCKIARSATGWQLEDLGSSNGTRIAGRVVKSHPLRDGDRVEIGATVIAFVAPAAPVKQMPTLKRATSARERVRQKRRR